MKPTSRRLLEAILPVPTAPFFEHGVRSALERAAQALGLTSSRDGFGNLYVHYQRGDALPIAFTAHMDHPGFEIVAAGTRARGVLLGGVRAECLAAAPVACFASATPTGPICGRILRTSSESVPGERDRLVLDLEFERPVAVGDFGTFDLPGLAFDGDFIRGRALENLMSCAMVLAALGELAERGAAADAVGIFTRAEEVGFIGAGGVLRSAVVEASRPLVVLETSKELPGFRIGGGPVLRVGDRMTCFDPHMDLWLAQHAAQLAAREPDFVWQRALMTGGVCEASLYLLHGRHVGAIALALGNYHNMTPEAGIGAEFVSAHDAALLLRLLAHLAENPPAAEVFTGRKASLDATFDRLSPRLLDPR
jgi:endoglucanase